MTTTAIQPWVCHVPKSVSLYFVNYNESLDQHEDLQEKCIRQNSMLPLDEEILPSGTRNNSRKIFVPRCGTSKSLWRKPDLAASMPKMKTISVTMLYDRNDTYLAEGLIRNTSTTTMFYSLGLEIEGYL